MSDVQSNDEEYKIKSLLESLATNSYESSYDFKDDVAEAMNLIKAYGYSERLDELDHIDDPVNVSVYYEGLKPLQDRKAELQAQLTPKGEDV